MKLCILPGDGIGPEVIEQAVRVLTALNLNFEYVYGDIGYEAYKKLGKTVPEETIEKIKSCDGTLFGAVTTPTHIPNYSSAIVELRKKLNLYANIRPSIDETVNIIIIRENTEGLYSGVERIEGNTAITERIITLEGCERIAKFAFNFAKNNNRKKVHAVHKANILRLTDGLFLDVTRKVAKYFPEIEYKEMIVDNCAMQLIKNPQQFEVILTTNLFGDILSDEASALIGGLGVAYSGNIGDNTAIFEPVHGSAPAIAGKNIANPIAAIMAAKFMLEHLKLTEEAQKIDNAVKKAIKNNKVTPDLEGSLNTEQVTDYIIKQLEM